MRFVLMAKVEAVSKGGEEAEDEGVEVASRRDEDEEL